MGWPPCCAPGCTAWPAGREMFLCRACIKDPEKVHDEHKRVVDIYNERLGKALARIKELEALPSERRQETTGEAMTKDEMFAKIIPLLKHADEEALREGLEVAFNCGISEGLREAREMVNSPRASPTGSAAAGSENGGKDV